ncbi:MAG TPA: CNNM domain-containing protein, partial [Polyangiaceae bacterium]|nr:CNNM domain-containing protein [Polyangiaceae bacterium]
MTQEIIIILLLVLANGFFSGAEIAVIALRRTRIEELAEQGRRTARAVLALRDQPERFLATVQVGITVVSATAAAFGGASIAARIAPELARISWIGRHSQGVALALVVAVVSYLSIVVGELVPKSLALRGAERYALFVARPLLALSWLAKPVVWLLSSSANV